MTRRMSRGTLLLAAVLLSCPFAGADETCEVTASARQDSAIEGYQYTEYTFEVYLEIEVQCAMIGYTLVIDERLENGELQKKAMPRSLTLRSNEVTEYHEYKTLRVNAIEGVAVEGIRCTVCS